MKRAVFAAASIVVLVLTSAMPVQAAAACLAEVSAPAAMPSCCQHPAPAPVSCEETTGGSHAMVTVESPCCCDHEPAPQSPNQTATTAPSELSVALASPLIQVAASAPAFRGPVTDDAARETATTSPPAFLVACSFLI